MIIKSIASSSKGCCYVVTSGGYSLLIECGVKVSRIRETLNHDLSKVVGCLVSHDHGDHAKFLPKLEEETSIPIYCTEGTLKRFSLSSGCQVIKNRFVFCPSLIFRCQALELNHDKNPFCECFGFHIQIFGKKESLFYATDTGDVKYTIKGLTHLMIETNHSYERLIDSDINRAALKRICETHLSIDDVCEFVSRHPDLEEIHLLHMSAGHGDAVKFKRMIQDISGCIVKVADE